MSEKQCKTCQYYIQHYSFERRKIFQVYCGHCAHSGPRRKQPDAKARENYIACTDREDAFVSKEYLSKELLQYMLRLELLPEIEGRG